MDLRTYGFTDLRRYGPWDLGVARFTIYGCAALWTYGLLDQVIFDLDWPPGGRTVSGSLDVLLFAAPWTYGFSDARWTYRPVDDRLAASYYPLEKNSDSVVVLYREYDEQSEPI